jgi:hypothetical protein
MRVTDSASRGASAAGCRGDQLWKRAREYDGVPVRVAQPVFPIAILTEVALSQRLHSQVHRATHGRVEVVEFEPQQDAIAVRATIGISERTVVVFHIPSMQLQDEPLASRQPFILLTPVAAGAAKQLLVPSAAGRNIVDADEGR